MTAGENLETHENHEQEQKFNDLLSKIENLAPEDYWLESIDGVMTADFCSYLEKNPSEAKQLLRAVEDGLSIGEHPHDDNLKQLQLILTPIANPMNIGDVSWAKGKEYNWKRWRIDNINETRKELNSLLDEKMEGLDENDNLYKTLQKIRTVVNNWASDDVKELQQFLYSNLPLDKQTDFVNNNFRFVNGWRDFNSPDWMFGQSVVNWIKDFLNSEKLNNYIKGVKASRETQNEEEVETSTEETETSTEETEIPTADEPSSENYYSGG